MYFPLTLLINENQRVIFSLHVVSEPGYGSVLLWSYQLSMQSILTTHLMVVSIVVKGARRKRPPRALRHKTHLRRWLFLCKAYPILHIYFLKI